MYIPKIDLTGIVEIFLMTMAIYFIAKTVKGTRAWVLLKGIMMLMSVKF